MTSMSFQNMTLQRTGNPPALFPHLGANCSEKQNVFYEFPSK
jgi:hypothetical protein